MTIEEEREQLLKREQDARADAERERDFVRLVLDNAPIAIGVLEGPDHRFVLANPVTAAYTGIAQAELVGRPLREALPQVAAAVEPYLRCAFEERLVITAPDLEMPLPDGRSSWVRVTFAPLVDGAGARGVVYLALDITERKRTDERLRFQAQLLDTVEQAVIATDLAGRITYWNHFAERLYGWSRAEVLGRLILEVTPSDLSRDQAAAIMERLRRGESWSGEFVVQRRDGARFPAWVADSPIRDAEGKVIGIVGISSDVSDRRRLEDALRLRAEHLAEADRRKNEFLAMLAHELRNPLSPILNSAEILRHRAGENPTVLRHQEIIERQARRLSHLVDDLLDVSRITRGMVELRRERLDLRSVVTNALQTAAPQLESRGHHLEVSLSEEPLFVEGDALRLEQVVANLLNNAAKFTEPGGRIRVTAAREEEWAAVRVRDDGRGIPADQLAGIFDIFTQVEPGIDRAEGGLGLGLTLVRRLVEMHGGEVAASSDGPGTGAEFVVRLRTG
jgi:PAS domain S-box-containing protein